jgi:hypothetical protein
MKPLGEPKQKCRDNIETFFFIYLLLCVFGGGGEWNIRESVDKRSNNS